MKRLIKSEFFTAQGKEENEDYIEIFKNPTSNEIEKVRKKDKWSSIKGVIHNDGVIYIWIGDTMHDHIRNSEVDVNSNLHFVHDSEGFSPFLAG